MCWAGNQSGIHLHFLSLWLAFLHPKSPLILCFWAPRCPCQFPAVLSPCLLLSPSHPQLCRSNNFFSQSINLTMLFSFTTHFNDSCLGQSPNSSASCSLPGSHPSVMCVHGPAPATQSESESEVAQLCPTLCDPMSMGFSRQEYWSGLPFPFPEDLPNIATEHRSPTLQADPLLSEAPGSPSP